MHKVCTKYAQGCIQAIQTTKCANYASMHMPATCTGVHNLQSVRVCKFMCLHNMSKLQIVQNVQSIQVPCCVQNACVLRTEVQKPICLSDVHIVQTAQRTNQVCKVCIKYASAEPICMHKLDTARAKCCTLGGGQRLKCCLEDIWGRQPGAFAPEFD